MAKLIYPDVIRKDVKFTALADLASRLDSLDKSQIMTSIIELVDDKYIELLAEKWSVTGYDGYLLEDSIKSKRSLISAAVELHKYKGTPWAVKQICKKLGLGDVEIIEQLAKQFHEGVITRNGIYFHGDDNCWAQYRILLNDVITYAEAKVARQTIERFAPARSELIALDFRKYAFLHNNTLTRNGTYSRGAA